MLARAAESNPSCFSPTPLVDVSRTLIPDYLRLVSQTTYFEIHSDLISEQSKYIGNHWSLTKFCVTQIKGRYVETTKKEDHELRQAIVKSKGFDGLDAIVGEWTGEQIFKDIVEEIKSRPPRDILPVVGGMVSLTEGGDGTVTPHGTQNPEPPSSKAPRISDFH